MKKTTLSLILLVSALGFSQQKPTSQKGNQPTEETRQKKEEAEEEVRKSRAEKKAKMEAARKNAREQVSRDTTKMKKK